MVSFLLAPAWEMTPNVTRSFASAGFQANHITNNSTPTHCIHSAIITAVYTESDNHGAGKQSSSTSSSRKFAKMARDYCEGSASAPVAAPTIHVFFISAGRIGWIVTGSGCQSGTVLQKLLEKSGASGSYSGRGLVESGLYRGQGRGDHLGVAHTLVSSFTFASVRGITLS